MEFFRSLQFSNQVLNSFVLLAPFCTAYYRLNVLNNQILFLSPYYMVKIPLLAYLALNEKDIKIYIISNFSIKTSCGYSLDEYPHLAFLWRN